MKSAIEFHKGEHGLRHIARAWDVPKSTLARRVKGSVTGYKHASGHKPVLPPSAENELSQLITTLSARGFPLARKDIQHLAFQYAQQHNLTGFNVTRGSAGYYWLKGFMQRHRELSVRKPESLSCSRASGLNKTVIDNWFDQYEKTLRRPRHCLHSRDASRLNCLHGAIPIALAASDFPFRLLLDAVTHVLSVFRVCKLP